MSVEDPFVAYCAGLYEGEGSISYLEKITPVSATRRIQLQINMTDQEPLMAFQDFMDVGTIRGPYPSRKSNWKDFYTYQISNFDEIKQVTDSIYVWLSPRRQQQIDEAFKKYEEWDLKYRTKRKDKTLTKEEIEEIRLLYIRGNGQELADKFGVDSSTISRVVNRQRNYG